MIFCVPRVTWAIPPNNSIASSTARSILPSRSKSPAAAAEGPFDEKKVWDALGTVYDPEIPASIVELGLVYSVASGPVEGGHRVVVHMTLTAPGCGVGPMLVDDVRRTCLAVPGVKDAEVEIVFDPPWDPSRMSEAAKLQLGFM